jgi:hypothetical protein
MTEMLQDMAIKRFEFASEELYEENGDLQGFFLPYTIGSAPDCDSIPLFNNQRLKMID